MSDTNPLDRPIPGCEWGGSRDSVHWGRIPFESRDTLINYVRHGLEPGGFIRAVLECRLDKAVYRADSDNISILPEYVRFLSSEAPAACWGSEERVTGWMKDGGLCGRIARAGGHSER